MPTPYPGNPIYPVNISSPVGSDHDDAATAAVPIQQLSDRTAYLKAAVEAGGPVVPEFTNAILHGSTTFPDGSITGAIDLFQLTVAGDVVLTADGGAMVIGSGSTVGITCASDLTILAGGDVLVDTQHLNVQTGRLVVGAGDVALGLAGDLVTITGDGIEHVGPTYLNGALRVATYALPDADASVDGSDAFEYLFNNPSTNRAVAIVGGAAPAGWRIRFNAQKVTGANNYHVYISGGGGWFMRNATGFTVVIELVSDGTQWVVDDWAEGGNTMRNG